MQLADKLIRVRETILDRLTGIRPSLVLNSKPPNGNRSQPDDLAAKLTHALHELRATAMDESGARIDYAALRTSPAYVKYQEHHLSQLQLFNPQHLPTTNARRAFWINLYNVLVIDAVIAFDVHVGVTEGILGSLAFFRRAAYTVGGQRVSLDDIEHGILRGNRGHPLLPGSHFPSDDPRQEWIIPLDPRIHFALNCGARSCPPIRSYVPEKLDAQLDLATRSFVEATVVVRPGSVYLSQLFRWYRADFGGSEGVRELLFDHLDDERRCELRKRQGETLRLRYMPYDWGLNTLHATLF